MADSEILSGRNGALAIIRLNRPKAINALSAGMLAELESLLPQLAEDGGVAAVMLLGEGERGFCAGGDVRHVRELVLAGRGSEARDYFDLEYRVDALIGSFPKPLVALQHGVVMGGGIGLSAPARIRVAVEGARFAMPEPAIGFFADVGVNYIMRRTLPHLALLFTMSGAIVGPDDAMALGLTDLILPAEKLPDLPGLVAAAALEGETAIRRAIASLAVEQGATPFVDGCDAMESVALATNPVELVNAIEEATGEFAGSLAVALRAGCPTTLAANWIDFRAAQKQKSHKDALALDLKLAALMVERPDFTEGVRAVLIDKDKKPNWFPARLEEVDMARLEAAIV